MSATSVSKGAAAPRIKLSKEEQARRALAAVQVDVPVADTPFAYALAMGALVAWLALITLAYLLLLAFMAYLFAWHVYQAVDSFGQAPFLLFHIPMALVGGLLLLFLIKPVFFRAKTKEAGVTPLRREAEPTLFDFVDKLCVATGAPPPSLIEIDCEPNAAARLDGGLAGTLLRRSLVLRVGLPLAAGLNVRQFAGVLAHELGHFNQRSGMRTSALVRMLAHFFARVVFQRDKLDEKLQALRLSGNDAARNTYRVAAVLIESARGVLWLMLTLSELLTCGMLRRMEYDADNFEGHVAGAADFVRTAKLLAFLSSASKRARGDLAASWEQQQLVDDFPRLIVANAKQLAEHRGDILKLLDEQKTGWFDTHPCHADRVHNVQQLAAPGLVQCDSPAKCLFADFAALSREATRNYYVSVIGDELKTASLVRTDEMVERRARERQSYKAMQRFFRGHVIGPRPILPGDDATLAYLEDAEGISDLTSTRDAMLAAADGIEQSVQHYEKSGSTAAVARAQISLCGLFPVNPAVNKLSRTANRELKRHEPLFVQAVQRLPAFERVARDRLNAALRLLQSDAIVAKINVPAARAESERLIETCRAMEPCLPAIARLRELALSLRVFYGAYNPQRPFPPLVNRILGTGRESLDHLAKVRQNLQSTPYPFEHATAGVSIADALIHKTPDFHDPGETYGCLLSVLDRFYTLAFRTLARLTELAERVEAAIGLAPLADPPEKEDTDAKEQAIEGKRNARKYWLGYGARALAGVGLLTCLIALSLSPPSFGGGSSGGHRPAPMHVPFRPHQPAPPNRPTAPRQPVWPNGWDPSSGQPYPGTPNNHGRPQTPQPYRPPQPSSPGRR
jgi:Zn-dependent protease with chaperone function